MLRDPLYRQIRRGLRELKDGNTFELCANDLLQPIYPSLAPREGGNDAGLDGLIASENASSIQLICTTGEDVLGNLSGSIQSNLKKGGKSHACILATSRRLPNPRKRALEKRATELGRPLIQIYDQAAMAQLLYRNARWLKELLGLAGHPPALSLLPLTSRPFVDVPPVGREDELARLANLNEDLVLVGQPGSGKTHLLFTAAKRSSGRFAVDEDTARVTDALRTLQPRFLIVDDAHSRLDFLKRLRLLRQQIDAEFQIVASCWPGQEDAVCATLQTCKEKCLVLDGLPQKQIKEVIQSQKIFGPPHLLSEIIHQSQGKPGLAVTLCLLCWRSGTTRDVVLGTALARDVRQSFEPLLGDEATHLLGCLSMGGDAGMAIDAVAELLRKNVLEVKRMVEQLSAAGVLEISGQNISVYPPRLRQALVRDLFLKPPLINLTPYLSHAPDFAATTRVLIEAKLLGGELPDEMLRERLNELSAEYESTAFQEYAQLGRDECEWILDNHPNKLKSVAPMALKVTPEKALEILLGCASAARQENSAQGWPRRAEDIMPDIKSWIMSANPDSGEAFTKRAMLATALEKWFQVHRDIFVGVCAAGLVLSIRYEETSSPPGEPMTITLHRGLVAQNQISRVASLWPKVLPILRGAVASQGAEIAHFFHEWIHPGFHSRNAPNSYESESRGHAAKMMMDLLEAFAGNWAMNYHLHNYADKLGLQSRIGTDPIAEILFPAREHLNWEEAQKRQQEAADKLAEEWMIRDPDEVVTSLTTFEEEARAANISGPPWGRHICWRIAEAADNLEPWLTSLYKHTTPAHLVEPFLEGLTRKSQAAAEPWIMGALEQASLIGLGVSIVVKFYSQQSALWPVASRHFKSEAYSIGLCVLRGKVSSENAKALLQFSEPSVAGVVATNLWMHNASPPIPPELLEGWKNATVDHVEEDHVLERAFREYPDVAFRWIVRGLEAANTERRLFWSGSKYNHALPTAIGSLTHTQKRELINRVRSTDAVGDLIHSLVGRDHELFLHLLSKAELGKRRLDPLRLDSAIGSQGENVTRTFDDGWQKMAIAALDEGFSEDDVLNASQAGGFSWSGNYSSMFAARAAPFEKLLSHSDTRLRSIGKMGFDHFSKLKEQHLAHEKRAAIRGELA